MGGDICDERSIYISSLVRVPLWSLYTLPITDMSVISLSSSISPFVISVASLASPSLLLDNSDLPPFPEVNGVITNDRVAIASVYSLSSE